MNMKARFSNYKSHIKNTVKTGMATCNLYKHWADPTVNHPSTHPVPATQKEYDRALRRELQVIIIESVDNTLPTDSTNEITRKLQVREGVWQTKLNTEVPFGLNIRGDGHIN